MSFSVDVFLVLQAELLQKRKQLKVETGPLPGPPTAAPDSWGETMPDNALINQDTQGLKNNPMIRRFFQVRYTFFFWVRTLETLFLIGISRMPAHHGHLCSC
jgi:hypothetical protein